MSAAPPLVYFSLGALYQKLGDHTAAVKNFELVADAGATDESSIVFPTRDLRNYVGMLRKIERSPAEAPLTYSAIRSLERARKNRAKALLEQSRALLPEAAAPLPPPGPQQLESIVDAAPFYDDRDSMNDEPRDLKNGWQEVSNGGKKPRPVHRRIKDRENRSGEAHGEHRDRKTISEVLHDIYDKNIQ
jgi:hypothetical protein